MESVRFGGDVDRKEGLSSGRFPAVGQLRGGTRAVGASTRRSALVQQARERRREDEQEEEEEEDSLSSHPHYVNEVHDCSAAPLRVNYQWLLSLIG